MCRAWHLRVSAETGAAVEIAGCDSVGGRTMVKSSSGRAVRFGSARRLTPSLRVLLAEDNAVNRKVATRLLETRGHQVRVTTNGKEALAALKKETFDLVLMDVQMPQMDGLEATRLIRLSEHGTAVHQKIIALTAHAMSGDRARCLEAGMDGYLTKPLGALALDQVLESCLEKEEGRTNRVHDDETA
jgi:CheY-like chemotaxis protein